MLWTKIRNILLSQRFWVALGALVIVFTDAFGLANPSDVETFFGALAVVVSLIIGYAWREPNV